MYSNSREGGCNVGSSSTRGSCKGGLKSNQKQKKGKQKLSLVIVSTQEGENYLNKYQEKRIIVPSPSPTDDDDDD